MSALWKEGFPGVGARRCLQKCGQIVPAHHTHWDRVLWVPVSARLGEERQRWKKQQTSLGVFLPTSL